MKKFNSRGEDRCDVGTLDLSKIAIFSKASQQTLSKLGAACQRRRYGPGQCIISHGECTDEVMFLLSGKVKVSIVSSSGREVVIRWLAGGEVFGDYAAIDGDGRSADVIAVTETISLHMAADEFVDLVSSDPSVSLAQMRELIKMIRILSLRVCEMTTLSARQRLFNCLQRLARPDDIDGALVIRNLPTHSELGALISSQRHVVTSELNRLESLNLIKRCGRDLWVLQPFDQWAAFDKS